MVKKTAVVVEKKTRKPKASKTTLALALPGAEGIDTGLLDEAVHTLNRIYQAKGLETARDVAECVVQMFFGGSVDSFRSRNRTHLSFKELAKREDLQVSYQFVWNACAVVEQLRSLPPAIAKALPMSHHKMLLPIKDEEQKVLLATAAVEGGLSKRAFEDRVKVVRASQKADSKAGRPPLPAFAKAFGRLKAIVKLAQEEEVTEASFAHFSKEEAQALLAELNGQMRAITEIASRVRGFVEG